ncbi:methyl-accepting chemotaxis protein [Parendozoicomonas haliclonae]|uniref:Methyl-accepting chemotaxis protein McpB n=1 Tax=Parendozoicomonas haliclonae TaxID=1960125 RepID=A0A1X7AJQ6_9GAMM|nr:methyl-accepting chemotaxis protein [Parendozoicomonas haliclonae]SMA46093.1 Methyl-accepting chemotaxis protein McpB [Parendozoicomonas haliclonae]
MRAKNSGSGANRITGILFGVLAVSLIAMVAAFWYTNRLSDFDREYVTHADDLRVLSQQIAKNSTEAVSGKEEAFALLQDARNEFETRYNLLEKGNASTGLPPVSTLGGLAPSQMQELTVTWKRVQENADSIISNEETVLALHDVALTLAETIPQLQVEYDEVVQILLDIDAPALQVQKAQEQSLRAERIVNSISQVLEGGENAVLAADSFSRDAELFGRVLEGMLEGNEAMDVERIDDEEVIFLLTEISDLFAFVSGSVDEILDTSPELFLVREASDAIFVDSGELLGDTTNLAEAFKNLSNDRTPIEGNEFTVIAPGVIALLSLLLIGWSMVRETRLRLQETAASNEANQSAILRLLDELADLADGDLTVTATVTEDFTGAIADSINFSIEQLRTLVETINTTAVSVAQAAEETQSTARHLADASEHQAQEIAGASAAINEMAVSIDQVSANAVESSAVAERSVELANKGNEVVQNTIAGMDTIREQIQDTSKRIKRLGESSQEIGDIVSLINDIADQTNILALNAAIQASMAGDAGRGFAVVADEVQRLAERSSAATKQIEGLVKTIQTDTNEAVISMELTTSEVVRGASLAQDAGVSLEEIETVSRSLSELISNISAAARQQSSSAGHISNTMHVIQEITTQTSAGTNASAQSIGNLAQMASEMRESVSGFKLPEEEFSNESFDEAEYQQA